LLEIRVTKDGPYHVNDNVPLAKVTIGANEAGESVRYDWGKSYPNQREYYLCRCGHSGHKPYCDGTHAKIGFDGTETASRKPYREQAKLIEGPMLSLTDAESLCAFARFCDPNGKVWRLVEETEHAKAKHELVQQTCDCPSGRLVAWDNETGEPIEPKLEPSLGLIEDPIEHCSGPIWARGGIQVIGSDGYRYEVRNRMTLCRCGASRNKPFCDGSHAAIKFRDES
jgi:CDGSH-type Zn-finger protein